MNNKLTPFIMWGGKTSLTTGFIAIVGELV